MATLDMTDGVYRRIYAGFVDNLKVNSVSWHAEAWFWRLVVLADDFGNLSANWRHMAVNASPIREVDAKQAKAWTLELVGARLVSLYEHDGLTYAHIHGFTRRQPANKNGRRIQRFPMNPDESACGLGNPGESGGIQTNPGECSPSDSDSDSDSETNTDSEANPPQPPTGGGGIPKETSSKPKRARKAVAAPTLAQVASVFADRGFVGVEFAKALEAFYAHRQAKGNPLSLLSAAAMVTKFEANGGESVACEALTNAVANGWTGVYPDKKRTASRASGTIEDTIAEMQRMRELEERRTA